MHSSILKQKVWFLVGLTILLLFMAAGRVEELTDEKLGEEGERLEISKGEEETEPEQWISPGTNPKIRVLLVGDQGSIYHKEKLEEKDYPGTLQYYEEKDGWVIVNEVPLEEYLRWVVPSEMPSRYAAVPEPMQSGICRTMHIRNMKPMWMTACLFRFIIRWSRRRVQIRQ